MFEVNEYIYIRDIEEYKEVCFFLNQKGYRWNNGYGFITEGVLEMVFEEEEFPIVIYPKIGTYGEPDDVIKGDVEIFYKDILKTEEIFSPINYFLNLNSKMK